MVELDDWRMRGQEDYLTNQTFYLHPYEPKNEKNDHAHCEFCWEKFSIYDGTSHVGYSTLDDKYWICAPCYEDFAEKFSFHIWDPHNNIESELQ